ncbi:MAG: asparagine synthase (glutamine-hydrolyzing), partial [Candidatus Wallbacteria bacterium]|nr:asparagine synthase (glutamine-hydrolyzing) [Candidatus Wallbacteria bacterium]
MRLYPTVYHPAAVAFPLPRRYHGEKIRRGTSKMCGIAGIVAPGAVAAREQTLFAMLEQIKHRGPDDRRVRSEGNLSFGGNRLAIIDLKDGYQPFESQNRRAVVFYNGEIYNHKELRLELQDNCDFRSLSDGEVIAHGFEKWGKSIFSRLNGDFAAAVYDNDRNQLILARDRFGIKPLYYAQTAEGFMFCSEIKGLLAADPCIRLRSAAIAEYLSMQFPLTPETFFEGVLSVLPGHFLTVDCSTGAFRLERYWHPPVRETLKMSPGVAQDRFRELLSDSVQLRLQSDVPVGAFLSGGLDST